MKKILAVLLTLCLFVAPALAEADAEEAVELSWEGMEDVLAEAGIEGTFVEFDASPLKIWIPSDMSLLLSDEVEEDDSILAYFTDEEETAYIMVLLEDAEGLDLEQYAEGLEEVGTEVELLTINGIPAVSYTFEDDDEEECLVVTFILDDGTALSFLMGPSNEEGADVVWTLVCSSIQEK